MMEADWTDLPSPEKPIAESVKRGHDEILDTRFHCPVEAIPGVVFRAEGILRCYVHATQV